MPKHRIQGGATSKAFAIGQVVNWAAVSSTARAIISNARPPALTALDRLLTVITDPLRSLDSLAKLAQSVVDGDSFAGNRLRTKLVSIMHLAYPARGISDLFAGEDFLGTQSAQGCLCNGNLVSTALNQQALRRVEDEVFDERGIAALAMVIARTHVTAGAVCQSTAFDALVVLLRSAQPIVTLSRAYREGGSSALLDELKQLVESNRLSVRLPSVMHTLSLSVPPEVPDIPSLTTPDLPSVPQIDLPGLNPIEQIIARLKGRKDWDPEQLDPPFPWWHDPTEYFPPGWLDHLACVREVLSRIKARLAIQPPARPTRVTWIDGITSIETSGACAGDRLVVRGMGFSKFHASAVLLLPFADGCHAVGVRSLRWTDRTITVALPAGVVSGAIGFGDAAYVAAYNNWAAHQNALADDIRRFTCAALFGEIELVKPFGECPPDIGVNHLHAGSAIIESFTVNGASTVAVEPGEVVTLAWTVRNADHLRVERISATGPDFGGSTLLTDPTVSSRLIGPFTHTFAVNCVYRLTAAGPCGTVTRDLTIAASKRPRLIISGIEVTQSIQTSNAAVRLVDGKATVVRVMVRHGLSGFGSNAVANVKGRIRIRHDGILSGWIDAANGSLPMAPTPGASITVVANPQRNNTDDTLNFILPPMYCTQTVIFEVEVRTSGFGSLVGFAGFDGLATFSSSAFTFEKRRVLQFRYIRVRWNGSVPSDAVCVSTLTNAIPLLPTPTANIAPLAGAGVLNPGGAGVADRDSLLDDFDDQHNCSTWEALTEWLGSDCPDDDGAIWVLIPGAFFQGKAVDIPSNVCFTPPADGPYAAHELSHCLNQRHVGVLCGNGQQAQGGDAPSVWPNNAQLTDVPFDVTRNVALTLVGTGVFDVMTYCGTPNNTWPMPVRWDRLWTEIGS
ncbi:hypothetical protein [Burkholderia sp. Ac-20365]|uniref:hypothetical protein n=1 Tax=Burkholderia sp. Ac-20365 TaxID=2703897 RepID=UPI00197BCD4F|nr:hypothetical protein [Burkholderia sp. Ac-20365]MBN3760729.1 hypothetical protein [Burkholderia sp. Ac-20365]